MENKTIMIEPPAVDRIGQYSFCETQQRTQFTYISILQAGHVTRNRDNALNLQHDGR